MRLDAAESELSTLRGSIAREAQGARAFDVAAQRTARALYDAFAPATVLSRIYVTVPFAALPPENRGFAQALADERGAGAKLAPTTRVLSLAGTFGRLEAWCDRKRSRGHVGIPLIDAAFVAAIPMVARLLEELGEENLGQAKGGEGYARSLIGGFNGVFHVPDAATSRDSLGRLVIPAQDFVSEHGVKTVFGMGGSYVDGTTVAAIVFTTEDISRKEAEQLGTLLSGFKASTLELVRARAFF